MAHDPKTWGGSLGSGAAEKTYDAARRRLEGLRYGMLQELKTLREPRPFAVDAGRHPEFVTAFMGDRVSLETWTAFCCATPFGMVWEESVRDPFIFPKALLRARKYWPFIKSGVERNDVTETIKEFHLWRSENVESV